MILKNVILLVSSFLLPTADCNNCALEPNGVHRFGQKCGFMCHCKNNEKCDVISGECRSGCASMWYGPGCQYRDIAEREFTRQSDNSPDYKYSYLANDGNIRTCSYTAEVNSTEKKTNPFWRVWLPTQETIRELMIVTKVEALENFTNLSVYVEKVSDIQKTNNSFVPSDRQECYKHNNFAPGNEAMIILCKTPVAGNQIRIELTPLRTQLVLCDVRINGGRNIAFGRVTSQSSRHQACNGNNDICTSEKAVDGYDQQSNWQQCTLTNDEKNPWWQLDIGHRAQIWHARIISFPEYTKDPSSLQLNVLNSTNGLAETLSNRLQENTSMNIIARFIKLTKPGRSQRLFLCEVKIFGDCLEDICGYDCSKECHCNGTNVWDKITEKCSSGCKNGWTGIHCNVLAECQFGTNCSVTCSINCKKNRKQDVACDVTDGHCLYGCKKGYTGDKCDQKCENGTYGVSCAKKCSDNCKDVCNKRTGVCFRCTSGWHGERCTLPCDDGKWGENCNRRCHTCLSETCDKVSGACLGQCKSGFKQTQFCDQVVDQKETTPVLQVSFGVFTGTLVGAVLLIAISFMIIACICRRKYMSALKHVSNKYVPDTSIPLSNIQEPTAEIKAEVMVSTYETILGANENEHEYELSKNQNS